MPVAYSSTVQHLANIDTVAHPTLERLDSTLASADIGNSPTSAVANRVARGEPSSSMHESSLALNNPSVGYI